MIKTDISRLILFQTLIEVSCDLMELQRLNFSNLTDLQHAKLFSGNMKSVCSLHRFATMTWQTSWSSLVGVMICCLFDTKPSPEPPLTYCLLDPQEPFVIKFHSIFKYLQSWKSIWKCRKSATILYRPKCVTRSHYESSTSRPRKSLLAFREDRFEGVTGKRPEMSLLTGCYKAAIKLHGQH